MTCAKSDSGSDSESKAKDAAAAAEAAFAQTDRVKAMLEGMAMVSERDVVAKERAVARERAHAEYEKDIAAFAFDCSVWGNFLRVSWRRGANSLGARFGQSIKPCPQDFSTALYMPNFRSVTLISGNRPDACGEVRYLFTADPHRRLSDEYGRLQLTFETEFYIKPIYPNIPMGRPMYIEVKDPSKDSSVSPQQDYYHQGNTILKFTTNDFPRPATDDAIEFVSLGFTIYAPGGCGEDLYRAILLATGKDGAPAIEPLPKK